VRNSFRRAGLNAVRLITVRPPGLIAFRLAGLIAVGPPEAVTEDP
jgi:hypothetical protein